MKKKPSNLSRLLGYAEGHRFLLYASWVLSAGQCPAGPGALLVHLEDSGGGAGRGPTLCPSPAPGRIRLAGGGQLSAGGAGVYCRADVLPHGGLPGATNLRIQAMEHIVTLPLGLAEAFGSGKLRKIVNESSGATETYLAHQLPDRQGPLPPLAGCWCSSSSLTGGWGC